MFKRGHKVSEETRQKIRAKRALQSPPRLGMTNSEEHRKKISLAMKGKKLPPASEERKRKMSKIMKGRTFSDESRRKMSEAMRGKPRLNQRGANCHLWRGGITEMNHKIRTSLEYKLWREAVFKRDDWTCVWCKKRGGIINADHIKSFCDYPELRFAIDNGRTLCVPCHRTTETYGKKPVATDK